MGVPRPARSGRATPRGGRLRPGCRRIPDDRTGTETPRNAVSVSGGADRTPNGPTSVSPVRQHTPIPMRPPVAGGGGTPRTGNETPEPRRTGNEPLPPASSGFPENRFPGTEEAPLGFGFPALPFASPEGAGNGAAPDQKRDTQSARSCVFVPAAADSGRPDRRRAPADDRRSRTVSLPAGLPEGHPTQSNVGSRTATPHPGRRGDPSQNDHNQRHTKGSGRPKPVSRPNCWWGGSPPRPRGPGTKPPNPARIPTDGIDRNRYTHRGVGRPEPRPRPIRNRKTEPRHPVSREREPGLPVVWLGCVRCPFETAERPPR